MTVVQVDHANNLWRTPQGDTPLAKGCRWSVNKLVSTYDIRLDPCCSGKIDAMAEIYYTPDQDGLNQPWTYNTIFNPPFQKRVMMNGEPKLNDAGEQIWTSAIADWCQKAIQEVMRHKTIAIGILPLYATTNWFHDYIWDILPKTQIEFLRHRINYLDKNNKPVAGTRFDSILVFWDQRVEK